jgi:hypothetical protein
MRLKNHFRFLLGREPKESILGRFDATAISRYFPEFERECALISSITTLVNQPGSEARCPLRTM